MSGIGREAAIFLYAFMTGSILFWVYQILSWFRKLIRHKLWVINLEDLLFWLGVSVYLFCQIYRTTYGEIRWYFILGVVLGSITACRITRFVGKKRRKYEKHLEKENESR